MPWAMLAVAAVALGGVLALDRLVSNRRARRLRRIAGRFGFSYSVADRFRLARRLGPVLPPGDVTVRDLMYRSDAGGHTYAFTAVDGDGQRRVVMRATEGRGRPAEPLAGVTVADATLPLGEQYRRLISGDAPAEDAASRT